MKIKLTQILSVFILLSIIVSCDKEVSVTIHEEVVLESGAVFVNSKPIDVEILVDGKPSGYFTPDTVKWLSEGLHTFLLRTKLFNDHEFEIETKNDIVQNVFYDYFSDPVNFGSIKITSIPSGCNIYLNDSLLSNSVTPYTITSLIPSEYEVKLTFPEHRADSTLLTVFGSKETRLNSTLIDTSSWVNYSTTNSDIIDNTIYDVIVDQNDIVWMASRSGILQLKGKTWNNFNSDNSSLTHNISYKIEQDKNGAFWIGTLSGLNKIENDIWTTYTTSNSRIPGDFITDFDFDNLGNTWIATDAGLVKFSEDNFQVYNTSNSGIPGNFIKSVAIDKNDNSIWIGTNAFGIAHFDGEISWTYYIKEPPDDTGGEVDSISTLNKVSDEPYIMGNSTSAIAVDRDGVVWAGFPPSAPKGVIGGVQKFNGTEWETIDFGLISPFVNNMRVAEDNTILISTNNGLITFQGSYRNIIRQINSGLQSDDIRSAFPDNNGTLWFATGNTGLIKYKNYSPK